LNPWRYNLKIEIRLKNIRNQKDPISSPYQAEDHNLQTMAASGLE
jgi:hypothetical protein